MTITEFLEARIAEDEAEAKLVEAEGDHGSSPVQHPARVLAECAAKRALLGEHSELEDQFGRPQGVCKVCAEWSRYDPANPMWLPCPTLRIMAAVYADHPDYLAEWAAENNS